MEDLNGCVRDRVRVDIIGKCEVRGVGRMIMEGEWLNSVLKGGCAQGFTCILGQDGREVEH